MSIDINKLRTLIGYELRLYVSEHSYLAGTLTEVLFDALVLQLEHGEMTIERIVPITSIKWIDKEVSFDSNKHIIVNQLEECWRRNEV